MLDEHRRYFKFSNTPSKHPCNCPIPGKKYPLFFALRDKSFVWNVIDQEEDDANDSDDGGMNIQQAQPVGNNQAQPVVDNHQLSSQVTTLHHQLSSQVATLHNQLTTLQVTQKELRLHLSPRLANLMSAPVRTMMMKKKKVEMEALINKPHRLRFESRKFQQLIRKRLSSTTNSTESSANTKSRNEAVTCKDSLKLNWY